MLRNISRDTVVSNKCCVLVLGSHRSGTSVLTRALLAVGVFLGENFYEPQYDNPKGFFEDKTIHQLDERFLSRIDRLWNSLLLPSLVDAEAVLAYQDGLRENVFRRFADKQVWGLKDPRISRLWPYWIPVFAEFGVEPIFVLANRHPFSVANSLFRRDKMPEAQALALWAVYQLDAFEALLQYGGLVVDYDLMMDRPRQELQRISDFLGVEDRLDPNEVEKFESDFLADDFRHSCYTSQSSASAMSQLQALCLRIYGELLNLAQLPGELLPESIEHSRSLVAGFRNEFARSIGWMQAIDAMQEKIAKAEIALSGDVINAECVARLYLSEIVDGKSLTYAKFRSVSIPYPISCQRQALRLPMPPDLMPLARIRLDPANRPVALVLHNLALVKEDGAELWRWDGDIGTFIVVTGLIFRPSVDGLIILVLNADSRCELAVHRDVLVRVSAGASLVVELTPKPLLGVVSDLFSQNDRLVADLRADLAKNGPLKHHSLSAVSDNSTLHLANDIEKISSMLKDTLDRRDQAIARQAKQLIKMREQLLRAEAQLDLLKDVMLGGPDDQL